MQGPTLAERLLTPIALGKQVRKYYLYVLAHEHANEAARAYLQNVELRRIRERKKALYGKTTDAVLRRYRKEERAVYRLIEAIETEMHGERKPEHREIWRVAL